MKASIASSRSRSAAVRSLTTLILPRAGGHKNCAPPSRLPLAARPHTAPKGHVPSPLADGAFFSGMSSAVESPSAHTTSAAATTTRHTCTVFKSRPGAPIFGEAWTADQGRCRALGIGDDAERATKMVLAQNMIERALDAKVPFA